MITPDPVCSIRRAVAEDEPAIQAMVRRERLNPHHLHFCNFAVAVIGDELIGASQIRHHRDGSRELGSVVVAPAWRGCGISARIIGFLLEDEVNTVHAITRRRHAHHYERWGFTAIPPRQAPGPIRLNFRIGDTIGTVMALLQRRRVNRLLILRRPGQP
ncbi:MAG: GNAT family N-acetyltransferase [Pseudomonadota bacterium]